MALLWSAASSPVSRTDSWAKSEVRVRMTGRPEVNDVRQLSLWWSKLHPGAPVGPKRWRHQNGGPEACVRMRRRRPSFIAVNEVDGAQRAFLFDERSPETADVLQPDGPSQSYRLYLHAPAPNDLPATSVAGRKSFRINYRCFCWPTFCRLK